MADAALPLSEVLRDEYVRMHGPLPAATAAVYATGDETARLKAMYAAIHALPDDQSRTALCISGGGIRTATFALGVMQRLASFGLMTKFHFLSTISGGGYIGSWLSSFVRRDPGGMAAVEAGMRGAPAAQRDPLAPEIEPLRWLRRFSNYLTPKLGLMSGDTWAMAGSYLRNLLLVWLMFVPFLAAVLALPRVAIALLRTQSARADTIPPDAILIAAGLLTLLGTAVIALTRPVARDEGWLTNGRFQRWVLLPYVIGAALLTVYWAAEYQDDTKQHGLRAWIPVVGAFVLINVLSSLAYMSRFFGEVKRQRRLRRGQSRHGYAWRKFAMETIAAAIAGVVGGALLFAATRIFTDPMGKVKLPTLDAWQHLPPQLSSAPGELFLCLAVPLVLGILFAQATLFVGLSSWFNEEYDREWWGRAAGWVLLAALGWIVVTAITIYGPVAIYFAPKIYAALTAGSGLLAILGGKSGTTGANDREKDEKAGATQTGMNIGLGIVAPLFAIACLALLALCTSRIVYAAFGPGEIIKAQDLALREAGTYQITENLPTTDPNRKLNFETERFAAVDTASINSLQHLWTIDNTNLTRALTIVGGLFLFSWIVSFFIGANRFSMHGLYRNRLIRGYLGASRTDRRANLFSGFDPTDNLQMERLRPEAVWPSTLVDIVRDGAKIAADPQLNIPDTTKNAINDAAKGSKHREIAEELLAEDLSHAIDGAALVAPAAGEPQSVANRRELERRFPGALHPMAAHEKPLHVVGMCLNLVGGDNLAWQERKAESFTASPLHAGAFRLGYRPTQLYGGPTGISLGTAVAISGAAASPNMGYNSSPALSFLLTLFNVRLGWWLGNPKKETYVDPNPSNTLKTVLDEAFGNTNDENDYIYLSDGGHFDNLGLYEMVLRRCRCIVVSDGGADPDFGFEDLGNAIRKIRIDLGVDIEITHIALFPRSLEPLPDSPKYCAIARIRYSLVDPGAKDGHILYLKPAFYGKNEPKDVYNYATVYETFPHQSTGDQWFSESQFESYRQLGFFATGEVANGRQEFASVCDLIAEAEKYLKNEGAEVGKVPSQSPPK
jgi:hypothetical protein